MTMMKLTYHTEKTTHGLSK